MVSSYLTDAALSAYMYQKKTSDPIPDKHDHWNIKIGRSFRSVLDISLTPNKAKEVGGEIVLILSISVPVTLALIVALIVCLKRKSKLADDPVVDDNMYYGNAGVDYTYGETRVTDTNDYYED